MYEIEELDPRIRMMTMEKTNTKHTLWRILFHPLATVRTAVNIVAEGIVSLEEGLAICSEYSIVSDSRFEYQNSFVITRIVNVSFLLNDSSGRYAIPDGPFMY